MTKEIKVEMKDLMEFVVDHLKLEVVQEKITDLQKLVRGNKSMYFAKASYINMFMGIEYKLDDNDEELTAQVTLYDSMNTGIDTYCLSILEFTRSQWETLTPKKFKDMVDKIKINKTGVTIEEHICNIFIYECNNKCTKDKKSYSSTIIPTNVFLGGLNDANACMQDMYNTDEFKPFKTLRVNKGVDLRISKDKFPLYIATLMSKLKHRDKPFTFGLNVTNHPSSSGSYGIAFEDTAFDEFIKVTMKDLDTPKLSFTTDNITGEKQDLGELIEDIKCDENGKMIMNVSIVGKPKDKKKCINIKLGGSDEKKTIIISFEF